ncbi:MAG: dihydrolipoamide acetyltransferase family protein [Planctomycetales bacterium]
MAIEITVPRLGWSMEEGTFVGWLKKDGDTIRVGDMLFELEGEKALQEIEAVDSGILRIPPDAPAPGSVVPVGKILAWLLAAGEPLPWETNNTESKTSAANPGASAVVEENTAETSPAAAPSVRRKARELGVPLENVTGSGNGGRIVAADLEPWTRKESPSDRNVHASPRARRAAAQRGIDWQTVKGTGKSGRIRERDVLAAANNSSQSTGAQTRIPITPRRRAIAGKMSASARETAPVTLTTRANVGHLVALRTQFQQTGGSVPTYTDLIAQLTALALCEDPLIAGCWKETEIELPAVNGVHIGIAVDTPQGLLVPVLRNVAQRSLNDLSTDSKRLVDLARQGRLPPQEMQGGVFTITNLGNFGIDAFTPIINLPQAAILGLGAIRKEVVVDDAGAFAAAEIMTLSLTFDHRVIDGAPAARFLQSLVKRLENPAPYLLNAQ